MKTTPCIEERSYAFNKASRCGAKTRRNNGAPCLAPAVKGKKRCRMHGGAKGSGGSRGNTNALKHGRSAAEAKNFRKMTKQLLKEGCEVIDMFN